MNDLAVGWFWGRIKRDWDPGSGSNQITSSLSFFLFFKITRPGVELKLTLGVFRESWYWFLHLILRLFNPCIWSVESIIRSLVFFVCHLPFNLLIISVIDLQGLWTASYWPRQGLKEGGDATRGLFTRDYTSYEANGAIKYKDQYKESSQEVVDWYGILSLTDGGIFDFEKHAIPE